MLKLGDFKVGDTVWYSSLSLNNKISLDRYPSLIKTRSLEAIECTVTSIDPRAGRVFINIKGCSWGPYGYNCNYNTTSNLDSQLFKTKEEAVEASIEFLQMAKHKFILASQECLRDLEEFLERN